MEIPIDFSSMRHRVGASIEVTGKTKWNQRSTDKHGNTISVSNIETEVVVQRHKREMWDVVTPNFRRLSAEGKIVNSPMHIATTWEDFSLFSCTEHANHVDGSQSNATGIQVARVPDFSLSLPEREVDVAVTKAFANVSANESDALLWAGEARESIKMFYDIGKSLYDLVKKTEKQRKQYWKGKLSVAEAQSMTLGLIYGLLPITEALAQWRKGLINISPKGRKTFRGFNLYRDSTTINIVTFNGNWNEIVTGTETIECNIRAGVLADLDPPELSILTILEPRAVISTAWALSRLSFVWDWFVDVGSWLCSWSPTVGTTILSSWVTVETVQEVKTITSLQAIKNTWEDSQTVTGSGNGSRRRVHKTRWPVEPLTRPYLPSVNVNLNVDKILALILLFGKTSK